MVEDKFTREDLEAVLRDKGLDPSTVQGLDFLVEAQNPEPLVPELEASLQHSDTGFTMIHHPLVVSIYTGPALNKHHNAHLEHLSRQLVKAMAERNYSLAVFTHARPYRTDALVNIVENNELSDQEYWELLAEVWIDQENPEDYAEEWRDRFTVDREDRHFLMDEEERKALDELPDEVVIYRGDISEETTGLAWSTSLKVAKWFANRFDSSYTVYTAKIKKENIAAYWTRRSEQEVLVTDPEHLMDVKEL